jgi:hypothetical protein
MRPREADWAGVDSRAYERYDVGSCTIRMAVAVIGSGWGRPGNTKASDGHSNGSTPEAVVRGRK